MHIPIRRYGLLTREPVKQVLQGVREGFIPYYPRSTRILGPLRAE